MAGLQTGNHVAHTICVARGATHSQGIVVMPAAQRIILMAAALFAAVPAFACETVDDVVKGTRGGHSRVTVISETGALSRALSFMIGNADEVQPADTLIVIEQGLQSEVVLIQRGCATMKALSSPDLIAELLRRAKGEEEGELI
jgi:hypothetical protein